MRLFRAHGLGNDYLLLEEGQQLSGDLVRKICHRHTGVGGDGMLEPFVSSNADYGVTIYNPDGSIAEKSGNGLRIFAAWIHETTGKRSFSISTGFEQVEARVDGEVIEIDMGKARFGPAEVPTLFSGPALKKTISAAGMSLDITAVGVGNPHCVHFCASLDDLPFDWRVVGAALESHHKFPNRINVQFAQVIDSGTARLLIWERGAGETMASGSSSCAVAAAAVKLGLLPAKQPLAMLMEGGELTVTVSESYSLLLAGPVEVVGRIEVDPSWLL